MKRSPDEILLKPDAIGDGLIEEPIYFDKAAVGITHEDHRLTENRGARRLDATNVAIRTVPLGNMITPAILKRLGLEVPKLN